MNREDYRQHFENLELTPEASRADVNKAYQLLKDIYGGESLALIAMPEEISAAQTRDILEDVERSYRVLCEMFDGERHKVSELVDRLVEDVDDFTGAALREVRLKLNVSLDDVAMETRIGRGHLENIEAENFSELPAAVYTRGFVMNYAGFLSLDPEAVAAGYMDKFNRFQADQR